MRATRLAHDRVDVTSSDWTFVTTTPRADRAKVFHGGGGRREVRIRALRASLSIKTAVGERAARTTHAVTRRRMSTNEVNAQEAKD